MFKGVLYYKLENSFVSLGPKLRSAGQSLFRAGMASQGAMGHEDTRVPSLRCVPISDSKYPRLLDVSPTLLLTLYPYASVSAWSNLWFLIAGWLDSSKCHCDWRCKTRWRFITVAQYSDQRRHCCHHHWKEYHHLGLDQNSQWCCSARRYSNHWRECLCGSQCIARCLHTRG